MAPSSSRAKIPRLQRLFAIRLQRSADHIGAEHRRNPGNPVTIRVCAGTGLPAEYPYHAGQRDEEPGFLPHLPYRGVRWRFIRLDHATRGRPVIAFGMAHEQYPPAIVEGEDADGRDLEHRRADFLPQATDVFRHRHSWHSGSRDQGSRDNADHLRITPAFGTRPQYRHDNCALRRRAKLHADRRQWLSRPTGAPEPPTRKSRSTPLSACCTVSQ